MTPHTTPSTTCTQPPPLQVVGTRRRTPSRHRRAFSLLELLMAITALMLIVLVLSLVFQQAQSAWGSGIRQSGTETALRAVLGSLERDLSHAVDATAFGQVSELNDITASDSSGAITFYTLNGAGTNRAPQKVVYTWYRPSLTIGGDITRTVFTGTPNPGQPSTAYPTNCHWTFSASAQSTAIINGSQPLSQFTFTPVGSPASDLPTYVVIEARAKKGGGFSVVSGWSEGRNRPGHPEDKIAVSP